MRVDFILAIAFVAGLARAIDENVENGVFRSRDGVAFQSGLESTFFCKAL